MTIDDLYDDALRSMTSTVASFEKRVPPPHTSRTRTASSVFRYTEQRIEQAIIQKLARLISGLHAARILLDHGFFQEQAALQRMLDEFREDVMFLSYAEIHNDITALHREYLAAFYEEEFDHEDPLRATHRRPMVPRRRIHAYISPYRGNRGRPEHWRRGLEDAEQGILRVRPRGVASDHGHVRREPAQVPTSRGCSGPNVSTTIAMTSGVTCTEESARSDSLPESSATSRCLKRFVATATSLNSGRPSAAWGCRPMKPNKPFHLTAGHAPGRSVRCG